MEIPRNHKADLLPTRQVTLGYSMQRTATTKSTSEALAQRGYDGRYIDDILETRNLTEASSNQIVYARQKGVMDDRTEGVQRMKKEKRELEKYAKEVSPTQNQRTTLATHESTYSTSHRSERAYQSSHQFGTAMNQALQEHIRKLSESFDALVNERIKARTELEVGRL